jgi:hypothetical protein
MTLAAMTRRRASGDRRAPVDSSSMSVAVCTHPRVDTPILRLCPIAPLRRIANRGRENLSFGRLLVCRFLKLDDFGGCGARLSFKSRLLLARLYNATTSRFFPKRRGSKNVARNGRQRLSF